MPRPPNKTNVEIYQELRLDSQLCFALYSVTNEVSRLYSEVLKPYGITFPQFLGLLAIWENSPIAVGSLAKLIQVDFSTTTPLVKRLEKAGFVVRRRDCNDERRVFVEVTSKGWALRDKVLLARREVLWQIGLPPQELDELRLSLTQLNTSLRAKTHAGDKASPKPVGPKGAL